MNDEVKTPADAAEAQAAAPSFEDTSDTAPGPQERLDALKAKADLLQIPYSPRIGEDKLREKIQAALADQTPSNDEGKDEDTSMTMGQRRQKIRKDALRLVRVRIANMNPSKADLKGEIFTVASKYLGVVKRFVPYGEETDDGWHIPKVLYDEMKARKFLQVSTHKDRKNNNNIIVKQRWVPEFSIEVLPPLTKDELDKLAAQQAAAMGL